MSEDFEQWLDHRGVDCQALAPELRRALLAQYEREQLAARPVASVLLIPDGADDDQWQRAVRLPVEVLA